MRRAAFAIVLALLLPTSLGLGTPEGETPPISLTFFGGETMRDEGAGVLVVEVYYHALRADEYVILANVGASAVNLSSWTLTDREGVLTFPLGAHVGPGSRITVAQNATAYYEDTLRTADYQYRGGNATPMGKRGTFQLNNEGDEVILQDPSGAIADAFAYGTSPYAGEGWSGPTAKPVAKGFVARRGLDRTWIDTNTSADWDLVRVWSLGQSEVQPATFSFQGNVSAYVSPDAGVEPILERIAHASASIDLSAYTFTNAPIAEALRDALARGVRVRILLEGGPVGGIPEDGWDLVRALAAAGAQVHFLVDDSSLAIQERYRYAHGKYAILDGETVLLSSENWGASGFPRAGMTGSRGWTVAVVYKPLASYFADVFAEDFDARRRDIRPLEAMDIVPGPAKDVPTGIRVSRFLPRSIEGAFRITTVVGPDTTLAEETILGALHGATDTVHAQLFYAHPVWGPFPNPFLEALVAAARRGVSVRLLLDASPYNAEDGDPNDNDDAIDYLANLSASEGLDVQAKFMRLDTHALTRLHNKGFIVDGRTVLVSSVNWNRNSATANREAGLLIENEDLGAYFEEAFAWDWRDDVHPPLADAGPDRLIPVGGLVAFSGLGSWDESGIANHSWDLDGDGVFDAFGPEVSTSYDRPGRFIVRLRVADPWDNAAEDEATVVVRDTAAGEVPAPTWGWLALAVIPLAGLSFAFLRRRRKGSNTSRKME